MKIINVVVGIILDSSKSKVLVAQRNTDDEHFGQWEFPGGKIDIDEPAEDALKRELAEELGIKVTVFQPFERFDYQYVHCKVNLNFYLVTGFAGEPQGKEGQIIKWQHLKRLAELEMLEANKDIIARLSNLQD